VLIIGESGTGKELVARSIHDNGPNRDKPFIPVDCGSLVPTLIESELFGYVRGAFTGAVRSKGGIAINRQWGHGIPRRDRRTSGRSASETLALHSGARDCPVGSTKRISIDVRILAATNRDLESEVAEGNFRRDRYFRPNVLTLRIPPLRERKQDIPILVEHFLDRLTRATWRVCALNASPSM
jgi:two-component system response regulator HydG